MENEAQEHVVIDRFTVPKVAMPDFKNRIELSMRIVRKQAGFVKHDAYEQIGHEESSTYITIVTWDSQEALENSMPRVQAEYDELSFDPSKTMETLQITLDRGIYAKVKNW